MARGKPQIVAQSMMDRWRRFRRRPSESRPPTSAKRGWRRDRNLAPRRSTGAATAGAIMTPEPLTCLPDTRLPDVARLMIKGDCGAIPVINNDRERTPVGIITDRDIACRAVAGNRNPAATRAEACMTSPVVTLPLSASLEECRQEMEEQQIRRLVIVNDDGSIAGIVAQADIVENLPADETAELINDISEPTESSSREDTRPDIERPRPVRPPTSRSRG